MPATGFERFFQQEALLLVPLPALPGLAFCQEAPGSIGDGGGGGGHLS